MYEAQQQPPELPSQLTTVGDASRNISAPVERVALGDFFKKAAQTIAGETFAQAAYVKDGTLYYQSQPDLISMDFSTKGGQSETSTAIFNFSPEDPMKTEMLKKLLTSLTGYQRQINRIRQTTNPRASFWDKRAQEGQQPKQIAAIEATIDKLHARIGELTFMFPEKAVAQGEEPKETPPTSPTDQRADETPEPTPVTSPPQPLQSSGQAKTTDGTPATPKSPGKLTSRRMRRTFRFGATALTVVSTVLTSCSPATQATLPPTSLAQPTQAPKPTTAASREPIPTRAAPEPTKAPTQTEEQKLAVYAEQLKAKYGIEVVLDKQYDGTLDKDKYTSIPGYYGSKPGHVWSLKKMEILDQTLERFLSTEVARNKIKGIKFVTGVNPRYKEWERGRDVKGNMEIILFPAVFDPNQREYPSYILEDKEENAIDESAAIAITHGALHIVNPTDANSPYFNPEKRKQLMRALSLDGVVYWETAADDPGGLPKDINNIVWLKEPKKVGRGFTTDLGNLPSSIIEFYSSMGTREVFTLLGYYGGDLKSVVENHKMPNTAKFIKDDLFSLQ